MKWLGYWLGAVGLVAAAQSTEPQVPSDLSLLNPKSGAGIQGFLVLPQADLRDSVNGRCGFGVGIHGAIDLEGGAQCRPRVDYSRLDAGAFSVSSVSSTTTIQEVSLGADYLAYVAANRRGFYGVMGANLAWWEVQNRFTPSTRITTPMVLAGPGFRFGDALSVEAELEYGRYRPSVGAENAIRIGCFYLF
jgi:hypothetical protein